MKRHLLLLLLVCATGCASLRLTPYDSASVKTAKVLARVPQFALTAGMSEFIYWKQSRIETAMQSFVGSPVSDLYMQWGAPAGILRDGQGGTVLVYTENRSQTTPGTARTRTDFNGTATYDPYAGPYGSTDLKGTANTRTTYSSPRTEQWTVTRSFRVDRNGFITGWAYKGL